MSPTILTLCFLAFAVIMFVLEKIPLALTATILSVGLCLAGVLTPAEAFEGYVNSNVILCVGMFVVGQALFDTGMANKIGGLVTRFAKSERQLIIAIMLIVGLMSGFLSNTGTAAVLIPVVCGIADQSGYSRSRLLMPLVFAAALGGNLSIIGAPGNLMGVNALQELDLPTSFFMYAPVGLPMLLAGILYFAFIGYRFLPDHRDLTEGAGPQTDYSAVPRWKQLLSLAVLVVVVLAMIFEEQIGIPIQISACLGAILLVLTGVLTEKQALASIDLKVVFLFGGSLSGDSAGKHRRRYPGGRYHRGGSGRKSQSPGDPAGGLCGGLHPDQLHVQHRHHRPDAAHRHFSGPEPGGGPQFRGGSHRHRLFLRLRHPHRHAGQHDGAGPGRLQVPGLRQSRFAPHPHQLRAQHGAAAHSASLLPLNGSP